MEEGHSRPREQHKQRPEGLGALQVVLPGVSIRVEVEGGEVQEVGGGDQEGTGEPCGGIELLTVRQWGDFEIF